MTHTRSTDAGDVRLRDIQTDDLAVFFEQQRDPEANALAAFTHRDPEDRAAFMAHWQKVLRDPANRVQTILFNDEVAGNVVSFPSAGKREVGYWLGKSYWSRGIATRALVAFLDLFPERPLYGYCADDNFGSRRVLEKCGFTRIGEEQEYSQPRGAWVTAAVFELRSNDE